MHESTDVITDSTRLSMDTNNIELLDLLYPLVLSPHTCSLSPLFMFYITPIHALRISAQLGPFYVELGFECLN